MEARLTRDDAVRLVVRGGYPIAVTSEPAARERWFASLARLVIERITTDVQPMRRGDVAHTMLRLAAARTAQISNAADIGRDAGLGRDHHRIACLKRRRPLIETFVVTEILKQLSWSTTAATAFHYRTAHGREVDLVLETTDGRIAGVEVKAGSRVHPDDLAGLRELRDSVGSRFVGGLVVCTSPQGQRIDDRIAVAPFETLWSSSPRLA